MGHIPSDSSQYLFPALTTIYWVEKDHNQPLISLRTSPIELPAFEAFRPTALRFLDIELHDMSASLSSVLDNKKTISRIWELVGHLGRTFPNFYGLNLCVCRPDCGSHSFIRTVLSNLNTAVLSACSTYLAMAFLLTSMNRNWGPGDFTGYPYILLYLQRATAMDVKLRQDDHHHQCRFG